ncbi:SRPBCC domain-containing protein [Nakamurella sp. YIM 132087]|uniref:SRPBCC domain-containing protein n=1 Tax=Nakamurella alba TaxID=2665158 RepID=A0A7K1FGC0_9ACTN|nr:SRPBCC domain-containing protein [Nakamurella alba]MTD13157.1 SRPBCC domain-containing protein [Nakamurella alba]
MDSLGQTPTDTTGLTRDAGWEIGVRSTVPYPAAVVWELLTSTDGLALWLGTPVDGALPTDRGEGFVLDGGASGEIRSYHPGYRIRLTLQDAGGPDSTIQLTLDDRDDRTGIGFHQERLPDAAARDRQRTHWKHVTDQIATALDTTTSAD